jgi:hypothetical protein
MVSLLQADPDAAETCPTNERTLSGVRGEIQLSVMKPFLSQFLFLFLPQRMILEDFQHNDRGRQRRRGELLSKYHV